MLPFELASQRQKGDRETQASTEGKEGLTSSDSGRSMLRAGKLLTDQGHYFVNDKAEAQESV